MAADEMDVIMRGLEMNAPPLQLRRIVDKLMEGQPEQIKAQIQQQWDNGLETLGGKKACKDAFFGVVRAVISPDVAIRMMEKWYEAKLTFLWEQLMYAQVLTVLPPQ